MTPFSFWGARGGTRSASDSGGGGSPGGTIWIPTACAGVGVATNGKTGSPWAIMVSAATATSRGRISR